MTPRPLMTFVVERTSVRPLSFAIHVVWAKDIKAEPRLIGRIEDLSTSEGPDYYAESTAMDQDPSNVDTFAQAVGWLVEKYLADLEERVTREYHGAGTEAANLLMWLWTCRYDYRSAYPYALVGPRGLLPPLPRGSDGCPIVKVYPSRIYGKLSDPGPCISPGGPVFKWFRNPDTIPSPRCPHTRRYMPGWGLQCFLDSGHLEPCHF